MIESTGYFEVDWKTKQNVRDDEQKNMIADLDAMKSNKEIPPRALEIFSGAQSVLSQEFNFYTFSVMTSGEQSREIVEQTYMKELEAKIVQLTNDLNVKKNELESSRKMTKQFK